MTRFEKNVLIKSSFDFENHTSDINIVLPSFLFEGIAFIGKYPMPLQ